MLDGHHVQCRCSTSPARFESRLRVEEDGVRGCAVYVTEENIFIPLFMSVHLCQTLSCTFLRLDDVILHVLVFCMSGIVLVSALFIYLERAVELFECTLVLL